MVDELNALEEAVDDVLDECAKILGHPICLAELPEELENLKALSEGKKVLDR